MGTVASFLDVAAASARQVDVLSSILEVDEEADHVSEVDVLSSILQGFHVFHFGDIPLLNGG